MDITFTTTFLEIIREKKCSSQTEIAEELHKRGFPNINQSKISRMIVKTGAVKTRNASGELMYCLPTTFSALAATSPLKSQILSIECNAHIIVVHTAPGAAHLVARSLDSYGKHAGILGTIAGDDTVFVTPTRETDIRRLSQKLREEYL
ncbi:arginine repressor [Pantoea sp. KPR_PJ]|uniref:arginine repressor n=1 Tax=Pantoea sp. KPR_PJ TaxID=2738375 RepID=UPI0035295222